MQVISRSSFACQHTVLVLSIHCSTMEKSQKEKEPERATGGNPDAISCIRKLPRRRNLSQPSFPLVHCIAWRHQGTPSFVCISASTLTHIARHAQAAVLQRPTQGVGCPYCIQLGAPYSYASLHRRKRFPRPLVPRPLGTRPIPWKAIPFAMESKCLLAKRTRRYSKCDIKRHRREHLETPDKQTCLSAVWSLRSRGVTWMSARKMESGLA